MCRTEETVYEVEKGCGAGSLDLVKRGEDSHSYAKFTHMIAFIFLALLILVC